MKVGTVSISAVVRRSAAAIAAAGLVLAMPTTAMAANVRVMIDPGHGGKDPGAVSGNVVEKKVNLQISRAVAKEARRQGWDVAMTRNNNRFIPLEKRAAKASTYRADMLVSIHANSTGKQHKGGMTIYRTKQSKRLGRAIMGEMAPITRYKDIGNRRDVRGLAVLRASKKPAVIVEVMSVTAPHEKRRIKDPKVQKRIAQAIVRGIANYKGVDYKPVTKPKPKPKPTPVTELASPTTEASKAVQAADPKTTAPVSPQPESKTLALTNTTRDERPESQDSATRESAAKGTRSDAAVAKGSGGSARSPRVEQQSEPTSPAARFFARIVGILNR